MSTHTHTNCYTEHCVGQQEGWFRGKGEKTGDPSFLYSVIECCGLQTLRHVPIILNLILGVDNFRVGNKITRELLI